MLPIWDPILIAIAVVFALIAGLGFVYHMLLLLASLWKSAGSGMVTAEKLHRFAALIPAHNEESVIGKCVEACKQIDYPAELFDVVVVADNCTDETAHCAEDHGARVLVRHDAVQRGKGHALKYGFDALLAEHVDAILVLDADCSIDRNALKAANARIASGKMALQCRNVAANCDETATALLMGIANVLENDCFYAPKSRFGGFVLLRGTGMILRRDLLERLPWDAVSVVEDAEYSYRLARAGISVDFLENSSVASAFPSSHAEIRAQRQRWFGAGVRTAARQIPSLLKAAWKQRSFLPLDAAWSTWLMARPLVILELAAAFALGCVISATTEHKDLGAVLQRFNLAVVVGYALYAAQGLGRLGLTWRRCGLFMLAPLIVARYLGVAIASICRRSEAPWERLPRRS